MALFSGDLAATRVDLARLQAPRTAMWTAADVDRCGAALGVVLVVDRCRLQMKPEPRAAVTHAGHAATGPLLRRRRHRACEVVQGMDGDAGFCGWRRRWISWRQGGLLVGGAVDPVTAMRASRRMVVVVQGTEVDSGGRHGGHRPTAAVFADGGDGGFPGVRAAPVGVVVGNRWA